MIYTLDLSKYKKNQLEKGKIHRNVLTSLKTGFIYVEHNLEQGFIDEMYLKLEEFFNMKTSDKMLNSMYSPMGFEKAEVSDVPDFKEMLNWQNTISESHPLRKRHPNSYKDFDDKFISREEFEKFSDSVLSVQREVLSIIASALEADPTYFDRMIENGPTMTRAIHYPAVLNDEIWAEEHDDINLITALPKATNKGLQIKIDGEWVDASPPEGAMIINTGIMMEHVTNGIIPAGRHRVLSDGSNEERYSVVQFCHPTPGTVLTPLHSCVSSENPQKFDSVTAEELLSEVIWRISNHNK